MVVEIITAGASATVESLGTGGIVVGVICAVMSLVLVSWYLRLLETSGGVPPWP